jgi:23S rRNA pseudouridine1911/1915/1917 synthase
MRRGTPFSIRVPQEEHGKRFDRFLSETCFPPALSRSLAKRLIEEGFILLNGRRVKANLPLRNGDLATGLIPDSSGPETLPLTILYEDTDLLVIDKPAGWVVQPSTTGSTGTLVDALLHQREDLSGREGLKGPGIVHRLDKDTSGVLVVAKTESALAKLNRQFRERTVEKVYLAVVHGKFPEQAGTIKATIGKHRTDRKKMAARTPQGKSSVTHWKVLETLSGYSLLEIRPRTGRTHQIRIHLATTGHPIAGDLLYGRENRAGEPLRNLNRQALHAYRLTLTHPKTGEKMTFTSPVPQDMERALAYLRGTRSAPPESFPFPEGKGLRPAP